MFRCILDGLHQQPDLTLDNTYVYFSAPHGARAQSVSRVVVKILLNAFTSRIFLSCGVSDHFFPLMTGRAAEEWCA